LTDKDSFPVITIDGPSGAGKGAAAKALADMFGFHLLDSGAVYRAAALHALNCQANIDHSIESCRYACCTRVTAG